MGLLAWEISKRGNWSGSETSIEKILFLTMSLLGSSAVYLIISKLLKIDEVDQLIGLLRRKPVIK
jgi:hypothetical protein